MLLIRPGPLTHRQQLRSQRVHRSWPAFASQALHRMQQVHSSSLGKQFDNSNHQLCTGKLYIIVLLGKAEIFFD